MPKVSVIIPTFNRPALLAAALASVQQQTFGDWEAVVVNDAGCNVQHVISAASDARIRCLAHERNLGLGAARNTGIRCAAGEFIALLDDDDLFYPPHLETALRALANLPPVVYTDALRVILVRRGDHYEAADRLVPYSIEYDRHKLLLADIAPVNCFVFSRELALRAGLFDETLSTLEDWEFWIRLSALTPFRHLKTVTCQVNFRTDGSTMSSSRQSETVENRTRILAAHADEISKISNAQEILAEFQQIWALEQRAMALR